MNYLAKKIQGRHLALRPILSNNVRAKQPAANSYWLLVQDFADRRFRQTAEQLAQFLERQRRLPAEILDQLVAAHLVLQQLLHRRTAFARHFFQMGLGIGKRLDAVDAPDRRRLFPTTVASRKIESGFRSGRRFQFERADVLMVAMPFIPLLGAMAQNIHDLQNLLRAVEQLAFVAVPEERFGAFHVHGVADVDALHDLRQVAAVGIEDEMVLVRRVDAVGIEFESELPLGPLQDLQEIIAVGVVLKQGNLFPACLMDVENPEVFFDACMSGQIQNLLA